MRGYRTEGVVVKRRDFGEADRILVVFTKHYGRISVIAKGVRKITSRKGGSLELFSWVKLYLARGKNLDIITEVELKKSFTGIGKNLAKIVRSYYICELVDRLTAENQVNREVFDLLVSTFDKIDRAGVEGGLIDSLIRQFEKDILIELGFWPRNKSFENVDTKKFIENILEKKIKSDRILNLVG